MRLLELFAEHRRQVVRQPLRTKCTLNEGLDDFFDLAKKLGCFIAGTPVWIASEASEDNESIDHYHSAENGGVGLIDVVIVEACAIAYPIEQIALGSRTTGRNPRREELDLSFPEPDATWLKISFRILRYDGATVEIDLLRPAWWVENLQLEVGALTTAKYPELELNGLAEVTAIEPCPLLAAGDGSVVIGRFVTRNANALVRLRFADGGELVGTAQHPVWSLDHQAWIEMKEFAVGDWVEANGEPLLIVAAESLAANEPVYNLETFGEHVYEAGWSRVLVHNTTAAQSCTELRKAFDNINADASLDAKQKFEQTAKLLNEKVDWLDEDILRALEKDEELRRLRELIAPDKWSRLPKSAMDQMMLDAAKQGKGQKIIDSLNDPQFKGMEKWSYGETSAAGLRSEVHYVRDPTTGVLMDFKFKHHAETYR